MISPSLKSPKRDRIRLGFSGHETFPFRYTWLKKAVDAVESNGAILGQDSAIVELGVGKNMVTSIRHWGILTTLLEDAKDRKLKVSDFGRNLLSDKGWDPFLEDIATLWVFHWKISTNASKAATWYFAFNKFAQIEFTKEQLIHEILQYADSLNVRANPSIVTRDVDCFIRTYVPSRNARMGLLEDSLDCPLTELSLIQDIGQRGLYIFSRGQQKELPNEIFVYALIDYWNGLSQQSNALSFEDIAYGVGSPGLVFKLDEDSISYRLDSLEHLTKGAISYDETSGLRQIYRRKELNASDYLKKYFDGQANKER